MPSTSATVVYKKKDGALTLSDDTKYLFWTPTGGASPAVTVPIADVTNLQQTPATAPKVALKVFVKDDNYVFSFTHKENARKEQETVTDALRNAIAATKATSTPQPTTPKPGTPAQQDGDNGQSAAMAIAKAVTAKKAAEDRWYDDKELKSDIKLQKSLLDANPALKARFNQAFAEKPESVSHMQFTSQFWSARLHLLRSHAIDQAQKQGDYNVLPEVKYVIKPAEKEGDPPTRIFSITKSQINLMFKQYPIVKQAYDELTPDPMPIATFWSELFQPENKLFKKLKGEKITGHEKAHRYFDKYLDREAGPASIGQVPHFIDLEGNEQNHSQRLGNRPDETMRPSTFDKVPILRTLNNLSEKMLSHMAPEDGQAHAPIGMDEDSYEQLRLRDLALEDVDNRVVLNIREQQRSLAGEPQDNASKEAALYAQHDPQDVLSTLRSDLKPSTTSFNLEQAINFDPDSDSEDEDSAPQTNGTANTKQPHHFSSKSALTTASNNLMHTVRAQRASATTDIQNLNGLKTDTYTALTQTQATTTEFLHYFWTLFLSGDAGRTQELAQLVSTLDRSLNRINAVAEQAEKEREGEIAKIEKKLAESQRKTGKRPKYDFDGVKGGRKVVEGMVRPTVGALGVATEAYRRALEEQSKEVGVA